MLLAIALAIGLTALVDAGNYGNRDKCGPHEDGFGGWECGSAGPGSSGQESQSSPDASGSCEGGSESRTFSGSGIPARHVYGIVAGERVPTVETLDAEGDPVGWQLIVNRGDLPRCQINLLLVNDDGRAIGARGASSEDEVTEITWFIELEQGGSYGDRRITADNFAEALDW